MLKNSDRHIAEKRRKKFEFMGLATFGVHRYSKFSLNCGCAMCRGLTQHRRYENKSKRLKDKIELNNFDLY